jgi:hypothetical protein
MKTGNSGQNLDFRLFRKQKNNNKKGEQNENNYSRGTGEACSF